MADLNVTYEQLFDDFVEECCLGHDPASWGDEAVDRWRHVYADWEPGPHDTEAEAGGSSEISYEEAAWSLELGCPNESR